MSPDRTRWISTLPGFFLSVRVLSRRFRTLLLDGLKQAFDDGQLQFFSAQEPLGDQRAFYRFLKSLSEIEWVVYSKPPFGGPQQVLEYLGRYTHRVTICNQRLLAFDGDRVTFQYKDYRHSGQQRGKQMTLDSDEFIRGFLLHSIPPGFQRIRHYGILDSSQKRTRLPLARQRLEVEAHPIVPSVTEIAQAMVLVLALTAALHRCLACKIRTMKVVEYLFPDPALPGSTKAHDTS